MLSCRAVLRYASNPTKIGMLAVVRCGLWPPSSKSSTQSCRSVEASRWACRWADACGGVGGVVVASGALDSVASNVLQPLQYTAAVGSPSPRALTACSPRCSHQHRTLALLISGERSRRPINCKRWHSPLTLLLTLLFVLHSTIHPQLQDLLIPPGQTLADLSAKDAVQVQQLTAAAAAARADAIATISGQSLSAADAAAARRSVGKAQGVSSSGIGEIEPSEDDDEDGVGAAGRGKANSKAIVSRASRSLPGEGVLAAALASKAVCSKCAPQLC